MAKHNAFSQGMIQRVIERRATTIGDENENLCGEQDGKGVERAGGRIGLYIGMYFNPDI